MKPRLRRFADPTRLQYGWICELAGLAGIGDTPGKAFAHWLHWWRVAGADRHPTIGFPRTK